MTSETLPKAGFDRRWLSLGVITLGSFMTLLDATIVNVALPGITKDFNTDVAEGQLVVTIYLISMAVVIPLSGFLGERFGLKRLYMMTMLSFILSSALCAFAWSMPTLIFARVLQGLGGGMLQPVGMALMFTMITPLERGRFMVLLGLPMLMGPILGPTVGGFLVDYVSWRAIFLINLPVGVLTLVLAAKLLHETLQQRATKLDGIGFLLIAFSFPALLFGLSEGSEKGWGSLTFILIGSGAIGVVAFIFHELKTKDPLLQLRLFSHPMFAISAGMQFITQFCFFGSNYLLPLVLQDGYKISASTTGLLLFPVAICDFIAINLAGRGYNRFGPRPFAVAGLLFLFGTALALSRINEGTSHLTIAAISALRGFGMGFCMMPVQTMAFNTVPRDLMPRASALSNVMMRIFGSASTAMLTTILVISLAFHGAPDGAGISSSELAPSILIASFKDAFIAMAIVSASGLILAYFIHDEVLQGHKREQARKEETLEAVLVEG